MSRMLPALSSAFAVLALAGTAFAEEGRPLKMETIDEVIERADRSVQACHGGARRATLAVLMQLEIDAEGHVVAADPVHRGSPQASCLQRVARRLRFPSTGVTTRVEYPFMFVTHLRR